MSAYVLRKTDRQLYYIQTIRLNVINRGSQKHVGNQHIIELNGQRYDALTGALISTPPKQSKKPSKTQRSPSTTGSIDGFARPARGVTQSAVRHKTQKSQTLMRKTVQKPTSAKTAPAHHTSQSRIVPSPSLASLKPKHVTPVQRSPLISRFDTAAASPPKKSAAAKPKATAAHAAISTHHSAPVAPPDIIAQGLANATSHEQPKLKKPRAHKRVAQKLRINPKIVSAASFVFAFLLIGGFFVYQNIPGLTMRLATNRAGVAGQLPGYQPAGFKINGGIAYRPGQIVINYRSNSDNRAFKVMQDSSSWDSQALLDNYVAANNQTYQTVQDKGKTVYIYNDANATWVDGGIWYRIEGDSALNSDQLLRLAASL